MNILIAYFSHSGITRRAAEQIQKIVGGDLFEIQVTKPYPTIYNAVLKRAKQEIKDGIKPPLKKYLNNIDSYDAIFIGSPNWWGTIAPPVVSFLSNMKIVDKIIIPFITHGGGGLSRTILDINKLCLGAHVYDGFEANDKENIIEYIDSLKSKMNIF